MPTKPDVQLEDEQVDFFLDENLPPEDQEYLFSLIERDERLESILDTIVLRAIEVTDEGLVEGGDGTTDSVLSRLEEGEFVFTAKATQAIGVANLEKIMAQAEESVS